MTFYTEIHIPVPEHFSLYKEWKGQVKRLWAYSRPIICGYGFLIKCDIQGIWQGSMASVEIQPMKLYIELQQCMPTAVETQD